MAEIVVTAQKRTESLLSVPVSVTALTSNDLQKADLQSPADLAQYVPALQVQTPLGDSNPDFSLRGVSMNDFNANQSGPVALYTDEVYRSGAVFFSDQLYDIQRIEVLRGPQGTLYGVNATGGAVNFITPEPGFTSGGFARADVGNYSRVELEGAYQQPVTDTLSLRLAFDYKRADGFERNVYLPSDSLGGVKEHGVRLTALYRPIENLTFVLRAATAATGPAPFADKVYAGPTGIGGGLYTAFNALYPQSNPNTEYFPAQHGVGKWETAAGTFGYLNTTANDVSLKTTWNISQALSLVSVSSFNDGSYRLGDDSDGSPRNVLFYYQRVSGHQVAEDARLDYHGDGISGLLGLYYRNDHLSFTSGDPLYSDLDIDGDGVTDHKDCLAAVNLGLYPDGCNVVNRFNQNRIGEAVYTDLGANITQRLKILGGVRYTRDTLNIRNFSAYALGDNDGVPLFNTIPGSATDVFAPAAPIHDSWSKVTGRIGFDYTFRPGLMTYAVVSSGYRAGAVNGAAYFQPAELTVAKPETLDAAEVGFKGEMLDHHLQLATSAFYYSYKNQQAESVSPVDLAYQEINIGKSTIYGLELEATAQVSAALRVVAGISALHSRIDSGVISGINLAGDPLPTAPNLSGAINLDWIALRGANYKLTLSPAERYVGPQYFTLGFPEGTSGATNINPYWLFDARASVALTNRPITVSLWGKNLTDTYYYKNVAYATAYGLSPFVVLGAPRSYGAEIRYEF